MRQSVIREFGYKRLIKLVPADLLYPKLTVLARTKKIIGYYELDFLSSFHFDLYSYFYVGWALSLIFITNHLMAISLWLKLSGSLQHIIRLQKID